MNRLFGLCLVLTLAACSSSSNDAAGACTSYCTHILGCLNEPTAGCSAACSDPAAYNPSGGSCTNYTALFNCLAGLPCADFTGVGDGGFVDGGSGIADCATQGGCH